MPDRRLLASVHEAFSLRRWFWISSNICISAPWERSRGCKGTLWKAASLLVQRVIGVPLWPHPLQSLGLGKSFYVTFSFLSGLMKECSCSHWDFCISFLLVIQVRLGWCSVMVGMGYIWFYWLSRLRRSFII